MNEPSAFERLLERMSAPASLRAVLWGAALFLGGAAATALVERFVLSPFEDRIEVTATIHFQSGMNGSDHVTTIALENAGGLALRNLRGTISPSLSSAHVRSEPYYKPDPGMEATFEWTRKGTALSFQWPLANPGEKIVVPAIYHAVPITSWDIWLKMEGATFDTTNNLRALRQ